MVKQDIDTTQALQDILSNLINTSAQCQTRSECADCLVPDPLTIQNAPCKIICMSLILNRWESESIHAAAPLLNSPSVNSTLL